MPRGSRSPHPELLALAKILCLLTPLDPAARRRIIEYLANRTWQDEANEIAKRNPDPHGATCDG